MKLLFVHGRDQQGKDPILLQQEWERSLEIGFAKAGLKRPANLDVLFPYYGDRLDQLVRQLDAPLVEDVILRGENPPSGEAAFRAELLYEMAVESGITDAEIQANFHGQVHERGPLNWEWIQAILKALNRTPLGDKAIDRFTRDVYVYLTNDAVREIINEIVNKPLLAGTYVVVGHSLGSVVGYNVLRGLSPAVRVTKYVTVGSPLGVKPIQRRLQSPLSMPPTVKDWYNAMDERDVVALYPLDKRSFDISPAIRNKTTVRNHTENRHGIAGYLDDVDVAREIHAALTS